MIKKTVVASEAKQSRGHTCGFLVCFASLAMTDEEEIK